jgi:hypothetical protein
VTQHSWNFFRAGGFDQVKLETSADLIHLPTLDKKLWVALALPTAGIGGDARTLSLLDADGDGRVRADDILGAVKFVCDRLADPAAILAPAPSLALSSLRADNDLGRDLVRAARALLGKTEAGERTDIRIGDVANPTALYAAMPFNGDGVITGKACQDAETLAALEDAIKCTAGTADRGGETGISAAELGRFFDACKAHAEWVAAGEKLRAGLSFDAEQACAAIEPVRARIEDWFARVGIVRFDPRAAGPLDVAEAVYGAMASTGLTAEPGALESQPLARLTDGGAIPLGDAVNPAWRSRVDAFVAQVVTPILGKREALTLADWQAIRDAVAPFAAWRAAPAGTEVGSLGIARIHALVEGNAQATLLALIDRDLEQKPQADGLDDLIRLVHYYAHLGRILRNFVNFADFYGRRVPALFQAGRAWFDQRSYDLVLPVVDAGRHASMAGRAGIYLAYLDCTRRSDGLKANVCVAVTDGDSDNLMVGRNGLYYDREGRDYDATVSKIIDNPISLRQAFWSPYKKFVRTVEDMVAARAKAAEAKSDAAISAAADATANADTKAPAAPAPGIDVGTVAAIGVAVGGISTVLVAVLTGILGLGWMMPLAFVGLMLLISGPSVLIAALKLRQRNLGPLLDADGWAVNAPAFVNIPFGRSLTQVAELPAGSQRDLADPFVEKRSRAPFFITVVVLLLGGGAFLWKMGWVTLPGM